MNLFYSRLISSKFIATSLMLLIALGSFAQNWNEVIKAVASDRAVDDLFGSVSISGDYAIIGAITEDEDTVGGNTMNNAGSAYLFERNTAGIWTEAQKIVASDRATVDYFGTSVSISGDYVIVGASSEDQDTTGGNTKNDAGAVYVFERNASGQWDEVQKIVASDRASGDNFGGSVSISGDYVIVGSGNEDEDTTGGNTKNGAGSAYIFERDTLGVWHEVQKIVASDREIKDYFGISVSISGDYAIIGAQLEDEDATGGNTMSQAGSAYVFERNGSGVWHEVQKIVASDRAIGDIFTSVSISGDYAIVGAPQEDQDVTGGNTLKDPGSAYIFERNGSGVWNEVQKIVASVRKGGDSFGGSVSISGDYAIIGAINEDEDTTGGNTLMNAGSAYLFERNASGVWNEVQKMVASDRAVDDRFGFSVFISGSSVVVGVPHEDEDTSGGNTMIRAGSAYFFERTTVVGLIENNFGNKFILFPNPTDGNFSVDLGENYKSIITTVTDISGRIIQTNNYSNSQLLNLKIDGPSGIYLLVIESENKKAVIRIAKE